MFSIVKSSTLERLRIRAGRVDHLEVSLGSLQWDYNRLVDLMGNRTKDSEYAGLKARLEFLNKWLQTYPEPPTHLVNEASILTQQLAELEEWHN